MNEHTVILNAVKDLLFGQTRREQEQILRFAQNDMAWQLGT